MIQATELRIGNIVSLIDRRGEVHIPNGITYKIYSINILTCVFCDARLNFAECQQSDFFDVDISDLSPIPLTEEILLKCGFDEDEVVKCLYHLKIGNIIISITIEGSDVLDVTFANTNITGVSIDTESCLYLHGLQNITHALTNTELNITL